MSVRRNAIANFLGQAWASVLGIALIPLYISFLGVEAYGLIGVFALLQVWLSLLDFGMTPMMSREMARFTAGGQDGESIRSLLRTVEAITVAMAVVIGIGIWAASGWLASNWLNAQSLPQDVVARSLSIMGLLAGLRFVEGIYRSSIVGLQRQVSANVVAIMTGTLRSGGAVLVLAWLSPTIDAFFVWQAAVSAVGVLVFAAIVYRALPAAADQPKFSLSRLQGVWRFAAGAMVVTILGLLLSQSDKVVLTASVSLRDFAVYSLAYSGASAVRLLAQPIDVAVFPRLTQLHETGERVGLSDLYHTAAQFQSVLVGGVGIFVAAFGAELLELWTQDASLADEAGAILWILALGMVLNGMMNAPYYLQMAAGWTSLLIRVNLVMVAVFVPLIVVLTRTNGIVGAAVAWSLVNVAYVVVTAGLMHRRLLIGELRAWYVEDLGRPLIPAASVALVLRLFAPDSPGTLQALAFLVIALLCIVAAAVLGAGRIRRGLIARLAAASSRT